MNLLHFEGKLGAELLQGAAERARRALAHYLGQVVVEIGEEGWGLGGYGVTTFVGRQVDARSRQLCLVVVVLLETDT